ncbi:hypothetical protein ElyMa_002203300 [Elysia marginata]|uniref:Reverse transcriptase domain-containing protein n=1 Tax=Elysia marginata TaxID=1093978 RepID=A0AAV4FSU0_9GAST|nr:hypothetical protein ElyMa_002203300 [Elysia marginata]
MTAIKRNEKMHTSLLLEAFFFFFADDCALMTHKSDDLKTLLSVFPKVSRDFGLTISLGQIVRSDFNRHPLQRRAANHHVESFTYMYPYLESIMVSDGFLDKELAVRISKACQSFGGLDKLSFETIECQHGKKTQGVQLHCGLMWDCKA